MTISVQRMTLPEYLDWSKDRETRYELVNGVPTEMPAESDINQRIATLLLSYLLQLGIPHYRLRIGLEIAVSGRFTTVRIPDLAVLSEDAATALDGATRAIITQDMPPPCIVVEIVSPRQGSRDYRHKRSEYAAREISEYWIVDPIEQKITILTWVDGLYQEAVYRGGATLLSTEVENLDITATALLSG